VSNGVVYVGSGDKNLYAIDAGTGKEKWRFTTGSYVVSSPAVSNGVVYVGSLDKNLYAVGGVPSTQVTALTVVSTTEIQTTPISLLPSNSGIKIENWVENLYYLLVGILLIGIFYEGWETIKH